MSTSSSTLMKKKRFVAGLVQQWMSILPRDSSSLLTSKPVYCFDFPLDVAMIICDYSICTNEELVNAYYDYCFVVLLLKGELVYNIYSDLSSSQFSKQGKPLALDKQEQRDKQFLECLFGQFKFMVTSCLNESELFYAFSVLIDRLHLDYVRLIGSSSLVYTWFQQCCLTTKNQRNKCCTYLEFRKQVGQSTKQLKNQDRTRIEQTLTSRAKKEELLSNIQHLSFPKSKIQLDHTYLEDQAERKERETRIHSQVEEEFQTHTNHLNNQEVQLNQCTLAVSFVQRLLAYMANCQYRCPAPDEYIESNGRLNSWLHLSDCCETLDASLLYYIQPTDGPNEPTNESSEQTEPMDCFRLTNSVIRCTMESKSLFDAVDHARNLFQQDVNALIQHMQQTNRQERNRIHKVRAMKKQKQTGKKQRKHARKAIAQNPRAPANRFTLLEEDDIIDNPEALDSTSDSCSDSDSCCGSDSDAKVDPNEQPKEVEQQDGNKNHNNTSRVMMLGMSVPVEISFLCHENIHRTFDSMVAKPVEELIKVLHQYALKDFLDYVTDRYNQLENQLVQQFPDLADLTIDDLASRSVQHLSFTMIENYMSWLGPKDGPLYRQMVELLSCLYWIKQAIYQEKVKLPRMKSNLAAHKADRRRHLGLALSRSSTFVVHAQQI